MNTSRKIHDEMVTVEGKNVWLLREKEKSTERAAAGILFLFPGTVHSCNLQSFERNTTAMKHLLFDLKKEYYYSCFVSILEALKNDARFSYSFYVGEDDERRFGIVPVSNRKRIELWLTAKGHPITRSRKGFDAIIAGDALKCEHAYDNVPVFVSDHGPGTKTLRIRNVCGKKRRYHVFVEGAYWMETIRRLGYGDEAEWHLCGVPKLDPLFWEGYYDRDSILENAGLDPVKKTVLYAPSYRPSCIPFIKGSIVRLVPRYNLIIKLHPYSWGGKYAPASQSSMYRRLAEKNREMVLVPREDYDFHPCMYAADTVISDTSSALAICLALGKTGIIGDFPYPRMQHSDGAPVVAQEPSEYLKGIFVHLTSPDSLEQAVEEALEVSDARRARLEAFRRYYFYPLDGKAGERALGIVAATLGMQPRHP